MPDIHASEKVTIPRDRPVILAMYSGGLDSTGMLFKLFKDKTHHVHVHHMHLVDAQKRVYGEHLAVNSILTQFKEMGEDFSYSATTFASPQINGTLFSEHNARTIVSAGIANAVPEITHVAFGMTKTDADARSDGANAGLESIYATIKMLEDVYRIMCSRVKRVYPVIDMTKQEIWDMLPDKLRRAAWSCRQPKFVDGVPYPCQMCNTCLQVQQLKK